MAYPISDVTRRVVYSGSAGTGPYSFSFEVLANTDIAVYKNTTLLTLTTDYTVTINANGTGSVTLVSAATSSDNITLVGNRSIARSTDFVTGGDLFANSLNDEFDSLVIFSQQVKEEAGRGLKAPITDPTDVNMTLPVKATRKGTVLAFNATTGNPEAGPSIASVTTVAAQSANINTVAANISSVNTVAGNNSNVTTVAGVSSSVTTVAGISSNVTTVAGISSNVTTVAGISSAVTGVAAISSAVSAVNSNSTNINTVASNNTNINTCATNISSIIDAPNQATAAAASAAAAAASAASGMYSAVQDKSANYSIVAGDAGDLIRVTTTAGARTITLPQISGTGIGDGFKITIVKWTGDGNAVTVNRSSSDTINGATSYSLGNQYSSATFVADAETSQWFAAASGLGTSNIVVDVFSGNNSTVAFTLSADPGNKNNLMIEIGGVYQQKSTYSVSGTTLTFTTAPPTGTNNIEVIYTTPLAIGVPSDATVTPAKMSTGAPSWDTSGNTTATGKSTSSGVVSSAAANISGAGWGVLPYVANSTVIDNNAGQTRIFATGADASTYGTMLMYAGTTNGSATLVGSVGRNLTFALQGGTQSAGTGIAFPATQSASSDANTLDDYEEGTWTTTTGALTNCSTLTLGQARYTKVGRLVTIDGFFDVIVTSANTLTYFSFTLPFPLISTTAGGCGAAIMNNEFAVGGVYRASGVTDAVYMLFKASIGFGSGANKFMFTYTYQTT